MSEEETEEESGRGEQGEIAAAYERTDADTDTDTRMQRGEPLCAFRRD